MNDFSAKFLSSHINSDAMSEHAETEEQPMFHFQANSLRGSNLSGVRAHNERLILSLVRKTGTITKAQISRETGLSAQTASVITRKLITEGLLTEQQPIRGKVGQPSKPMALAGDGAFFIGLKIGRRSLDLVLVDFLGNLRAQRRSLHSYPTPDRVIAFLKAELSDLVSVLPARLQAHVSGFGIAMPFQLWNWMPPEEAPPDEMAAWRHRDIAGEIEALTKLPVFVRNDATAACEAELVFGKADQPRDFLYLYFGYFIGGGLVLDGRLFTGRTGNAAGVGPMPVVGPDGRMQRLMSLASLSVLERMLREAGISAEAMWTEPDDWNFPDHVVSQWIDASAQAIASATLSASTVLELDAVFVDGWIPATVRARITDQSANALTKMDLAGIAPPVFLEGTIGSNARALGAAATALSYRYLIDQSALFT